MLLLGPGADSAAALAGLAGLAFHASAMLGRQRGALFGRQHLGRVFHRLEHALRDALMQLRLFGPQLFDRRAVDGGRREQIDELQARLAQFLEARRDIGASGLHDAADLVTLLLRRYALAGLAAVAAYALPYKLNIVLGIAAAVAACLVLESLRRLPPAQPAP